MAERYAPEQNIPGVVWRRVNQDDLETTAPSGEAPGRIPILVVLPNTRWQLWLHRLGVCRWHRHEAGSLSLVILGYPFMVDGSTVRSAGPEGGRRG